MIVTKVGTFDRTLEGGADVTATPVAWSKTTAALRAE